MEQFDERDQLILLRYKIVLLQRQFGENEFYSEMIESLENRIAILKLNEK